MSGTLKVLETCADKWREKKRHPPERCEEKCMEMEISFQAWCISLCVFCDGVSARMQLPGCPLNPYACRAHKEYVQQCQAQWPFC